MINVKDLKVADVRYFDKTHNGIECTLPLSKVVLLNRGDTYINVLNPGEIFPVYKRVKNTTNRLGTEEYFGTKIALVSGQVESGPVWLLSDVDFSYVFQCEEVTLDDIEDFVLSSEAYYHNREDLIENKLKSKRLTSKEKTAFINMKIKDRMERDKMDAFFSERGCKKVYKK